MIELILATLAMAVGGSFFVGEEDDTDEGRDPDGKGTDNRHSDDDYDVASVNGLADLIEGGAGDEAFLVSNGDSVWGHDGNDTIDVRAGAELVDGGAGNDLIRLGGAGGVPPGGYVHFNGAGFYHEDEDRAFSTLNGGAGDDRITVDRGAADIFTGAGNDTVDASGLKAGIIHADTGDLVLGSDVAGSDQVAVRAEGGAEFRGGTADEDAMALGNGSVLDGGGGDDFLASDSGAATLIGGSGDDWLVSKADTTRFDGSTRTTSFGQWVDGSRDVLDGGDGNDRLELSNGDTGTGGEGADHFLFHFLGEDAATSVAENELGGAIVTDFEAGTDTASLKIDGGFDEFHAIGGPELDLTDRVEVIEVDGDTRILVDDELAATLSDVTGLKVGFSDRGSYDDIIDSDSGITGARGDFDFVVEFFFARTS